ncbi:lysR substrate binding domain protein [Pseudomonas paraeruginosa]|nr:lysR substrate binding domain protein [Pseudomonas paraeruginosa]
MLDLVLLRTFVSVVDTGNFTRAGEHLHLTQSTVSQQVIRLEQALGCRLLDRSQRQVLPTEEGERLLGYARRLLRLSEEASEALSPAHGDGVLRLGVPEDLAGEVLMPVLTRFTEERPRLRLEVESGLSHHLLRLYRGGELDLLLVKQWGADSDCHARWAEPLGWIESAARPWPERSLDEPLPLVVFPVGALYRQEMIHALESLGRRWRISYSSASLASLVAAVGAGLGSACYRWAVSGRNIACSARRPASRPLVGWSWRSTHVPNWTAPGAFFVTACTNSAPRAWKACGRRAEAFSRARVLFHTVNHGTYHRGASDMPPTWRERPGRRIPTSGTSTRCSRSGGNSLRQCPPSLAAIALNGGGLDRAFAPPCA